MLQFSSIRCFQRHFAMPCAIISVLLWQYLYVLVIFAVSVPVPIEKYVSITVRHTTYDNWRRFENFYCCKILIAIIFESPKTRLNFKISLSTRISAL